MKRYISAILIPCLLLQLYGCYSWRVVETPEQGSHIKIYTKNNKVIESKNWRYENGNLVGDMGEERLEGSRALCRLLGDAFPALTLCHLGSNACQAPLSCRGHRHHPQAEVHRRKDRAL